MKSFLKRWFFTTVAVLVATQIVHPGIHYDSPAGLITATLLLGILNAVVRPLMVLFTLPLVVLSLGLFYFVINALLLYWVGQLKNFHVDKFSDALWGSLIISVVLTLLNVLTGSKGSRVEFRQKRPPSQPPPKDGGGPIIDV